MSILKIKNKIQKLRNKKSAKSRPILKKFLKIKARIKRSMKRINKAAALRRPSLPLNIDFYSSVDGVYTSYWAGKLISMLQREGKKKTAARYYYQSATILKLIFKINPLLLLLETLDKIKPTFRLRNRIVRRSIIKEYPIVVLRPRQLILALHWLKEEIQAGSAVFGVSLACEIAGRLADFRLNPKKNTLVKKRNDYTKRVIKAQFNIRYNFK